MESALIVEGAANLDENYDWQVTRYIANATSSVDYNLK